MGWLEIVGVDGVVTQEVDVTDAMVTGGERFPINVHIFFEAGRRLIKVFESYESNVEHVFKGLANRGRIKGRGSHQKRLARIGLVVGSSSKPRSAVKTREAGCLTAWASAAP